MSVTTIPSHPPTTTAVHNASTHNYERLLEKTTTLLRDPAPGPAINAVVLLTSLFMHIAERLEPRAVQPFAASTRTNVVKRDASPSPQALHYPRSSTNWS